MKRLFQPLAELMLLVTYYSHYSGNNYYVNGNKASNNALVEKNIGVMRYGYYGKAGTDGRWS